MRYGAIPETGRMQIRDDEKSLILSFVTDTKYLI